MMSQRDANLIASALKDAREQLIIIYDNKIGVTAYRQNVCAVCKVADMIVERKLVEPFNRREFMAAAGLPPNATASSPWEEIYPFKRPF